MTGAGRGPETLNLGRYLLDTHALLYMDQAPERLSPRLRALIADTRNRMFLSIASLWEMQIKISLGKLRISLPVEQLMARQQRENDVDVLPVEITHIGELGALPHQHGDPFDRMLVAQARVEGLTILSRDRALSAYDVAVRW